MESYKTVVINFFGGAGAGKSVGSWDVASRLKKMGYSAELSTEYAKELLYDNKEDFLKVGSVRNQSQIFFEQKRRLDRLIGKVNFIVTDCPLPLMSIYTKDTETDKPQFINYSLKIFNEYNNMNLVVHRDEKHYESTGRIHSLQESIQKDKEINNMLKSFKIEHLDYNHSSLEFAVLNAVKTFNDINGIVDKNLDSEYNRALVQSKLNFIVNNNIPLNPKPIVEVLDKQIISAIPQSFIKEHNAEIKKQFQNNNKINLEMEMD